MCTYSPGRPAPNGTCGRCRREANSLRDDKARNEDLVCWRLVYHNVIDMVIIFAGPSWDHLERVAGHREIRLYFPFEIKSQLLHFSQASLEKWAKPSIELSARQSLA
jgi:hypothetical protein